MVTPACYPPSDAGRRYSRGCPPYSIPYPDRRYHLSSSIHPESRTTTMTERDLDLDSNQPRKRIAVAVSQRGPLSPPFPSDYPRLPLLRHQDARSLITDSTPHIKCGRCRKRKIRCSGDPGNGLPCVSCKSAGYEPCLFLRVILR